MLASLTLIVAGSAAACVRTSPSPLATSLEVALSSAKAGARPVAVTLKVHAELQCGRLTGGALVFRFPAAERLPARMAGGDVKIAGQPVKAVAVHGRDVTITPRPRTGVMCDVIAPGTVPIVLTKPANVGNPAASGLYTVSLVRGRTATSAHFRIR